MATEYEEIVGREIVTTRIMDAPLHLVFEAWTDPDQLKLWWGPHGFSNTFHHFELKAQGLWRYTMHGPNGVDYQNESEFIEIVASERIVLDHTSTPRFRLTAQFDEVGGGTKVTFRQLFETQTICGQVKKVALQGNEDHLERLANLVSNRGAKNA